MKILIADNLSIVRDNVRQVMASLPRNTEVDEVADGQSALEKVDLPINNGCACYKM